jgi:formate hydrogenlyase subunit 4
MTGSVASSVVLPDPVVQALQVLTVLLAGPGITGVIARIEARLQGRRGPRILQPYYDIAKLFGKEALAPVGSSWVFLAAPLVAMTCYLTVPMLIPVLTTFPCHWDAWATFWVAGSCWRWPAS